jgi:hypothetical protein
MFYCIGFGLLGLWMEWIVGANQTLVADPFLNPFVFLKFCKASPFWDSLLAFRRRTLNLA